MKKISFYTLFAATFLLAFSGNSLYAKTTTGATTTPATFSDKVTVSAGLTPDSYFYFLDIWGEKLSSLLNFTAEQKIKFEIELAKKRLAEYKEIKNNDTISSEVTLATKNQIKEHIKEALNEEKEAKNSGDDIYDVESDVHADILDIDEDIKNIDNDQVNNSNKNENNNDDKKNHLSNNSMIHTSLKVKTDQEEQDNSFLEGEINESSDLLDK